FLGCFMGVVSSWVVGWCPVLFPCSWGVCLGVGVLGGSFWVWGFCFWVVCLGVLALLVFVLWCAVVFGGVDLRSVVSTIVRAATVGAIVATGFV
ncbi:hypothetical protein RA264_28105, partial [Pseudomonas syringae pv. tagetis]|uniref:hypothetical protein n=1 Tax=Pseudomonas syringae group genomosp. 7 TaxID=251699 RepID=UPI0037703435